jgi:hypothetical protein
MNNLVSDSFEITEKQIEDFKRKGFLHLKNFYSKPFISYILKKTNDDIAEPVDKYQAGFSRVAFDLFNGDPTINSLLESKKFREIMKSLTEKKLIYTQGLGFELKKNDSKGFPWHIGTQSFGYQQADDFGCTIWTPLAPIKKESQRGGMAYVPKDIVSGAFMYTDVDPAISDKMQEKIDNKEDLTIDDFVHLRDGPLNDPAMKRILDHFGEEDNFELGDALIFDKHVIHRSVMLGEGEIASRSAFVMRFVCSDSKYDKKRAQDLEIPRKHFNYSGPTSFHLDVCKSDGDLIKNSHLFKDDLEVRVLS